MGIWTWFSFPHPAFDSSYLQEANLYSSAAGATSLAMRLANAHRHLPLAPDTALAGLVEKGAAYLREEAASPLYLPVPVEKFFRELSPQSGKTRSSSSAMLRQVVVEDGYLTIRGSRHILDRMRSMIRARRRSGLYLRLSRGFRGIVSRPSGGRDAGRRSRSSPRRSFP